MRGTIYISLITANICNLYENTLTYDLKHYIILEKKMIDEYQVLY